MHTMNSFQRWQIEGLRLGLLIRGMCPVFVLLIDVVGVAGEMSCSAFQFLMIVLLGFFSSFIVLLLVRMMEDALETNLHLHLHLNGDEDLGY